MDGWMDKGQCWEKECKQENRMLYKHGVIVDDSSLVEGGLDRVR